MTNTENHQSLFDDVPDKALSAHYVIWVRPSRSIIPWRVLNSGGEAKVYRSADTANQEAIRLSETSGLCAVVSRISLPAEVSQELTAVLSTGETWNVLD